MYTTKFSEIVQKYDVVLFDSYGVLKNYNGIIEGARETMASLEKRKVPYRVLTNDASSSPKMLSEKFEIGGLNIKTEHIVTSGMMAKSFLSTKSINGKVLYLGTENSSQYIIEANKEAISISDYDDSLIHEIGAVVFLDDEGYQWSTDINKAVNLLRKRTIPVIVANSDKLYPVAKNDVSIATGAIAQLVESILNRDFIHFGKPDVQMFAFAFDSLIKEHGELNKSKVLMVGDTLHTDILGGTKFGVDTLLVLSGNTSVKNAESMIQSTGVAPDYIAESIAH
ncbi:MAG: HAD-IIA family hydrolase [Saprospiraceae bacterium]|nr:HAD-IIA family hydrolase [Saprospiraceae bacterium]